jgi:hypothetical protein
VDFSTLERKLKMKRSKEWWGRLNEDERATLVYMEQVKNKIYHSAYIPDDCCECPVCSVPHMGWGLCTACNKTYLRILNKACGI